MNGMNKIVIQDLIRPEIILSVIKRRALSGPSLEGLKSGRGRCHGKIFARE